MARNRHLFFAWLLVINGSACLLYAAYSGHLTRDLPLRRAARRSIGRPVIDHLLFRHPTSEAAKRYNVLRDLACLAMIFGLLPLIVVAGMAMSHRLDAVYSGSVDLLGGRQSAHTLHFLAATGLLVPADAEDQALLRGGFADWKLELGGLVEVRAAFTLAELRAMPARTPITRHDCVEGWSSIGKWKGAPLSRCWRR